MAPKRDVVTPTEPIDLRMPVGLYDRMIAAIERHHLWAKPERQSFIFAAVAHYVAYLEENAAPSAHRRLPAGTEGGGRSSSEKASD